MPSSKFSQRPVPRRRPAICASLRRPITEPPPGKVAGEILGWRYCLPTLDSIYPKTLIGTWGHVDRDPGKPGIENPVLHASGLAPRVGTHPVHFHATGVFYPPVEGNIDTLLDCHIIHKQFLSYYKVTLWLWWMWGTGEFTWDWVWISPTKPFDTGLLTDVVIPGRDYRYCQFSVLRHPGPR